MIRFFTACVFLFLSCSSRINNKSKPMKQEVIAFEIIAQDDFGGMTDSKFIAIKDQKALNEIYNIISEGRLPELKAPPIDFEKETVIALFLGEKTSGGYAITVGQILNIDDKINVAYKITAPKRGEMVTTVMTQPYCIIKIPKTSKKVTFSSLN